jgi:hypothetical protein
MPRPLIYNNWLPAEVADKARHDEPLAFKAALKGFQNEVVAVLGAPDGDLRWPRALPWLDELKT